MSHVSVAPDGDENHLVRVADQEEVELAGVDADGHAHPNRAARGLHDAEATQRCSHAMRGRHTARGVVVALEKQQDRVAAVLQQAPAIAARRAS